jgi:hypothetical protein
MPISSVAQAKTGFHSVTSPFLRYFSATVLGRSNTHTSGAPPQLARCCAKLRTRLSTVSSFTSQTRTQREYLRREAKDRTRRSEHRRQKPALGMPEGPMWSFDRLKHRNRIERERRRLKPLTSPRLNACQEYGKLAARLHAAKFVGA